MSSAALRVGVALLSASNPTQGVTQLIQLLAVEGLGRVTEDGRVEPQLAEGWTLAADRRSLVVKVKPGLRLHDGSLVDSTMLAEVLPQALRTTMGPVVEDVIGVTPAGTTGVKISFRRSSPLLLESMEVPIKKPGPVVIATGPFMVVPDSTTQLRANRQYQGARPAINDINIQTFPSIRGAWAELLRNHLDMLWEVGPDALDSLGSSTNVSIFTFIRPYQYVVAFNPHSAPLRSSVVRRALSLAVDRGQLVRRTLNKHAIPSSGPISPKYWALQPGSPTFNFDPQQAALLLTNKTVRFSLLIPPDEVYERIALELKRQLAAVNVDMEVRSATQDQMYEAQRTGTYDAVLVESVSGPSVLRVFQRWHTHGAVNAASQGNGTIDAALEVVRHAEDETQYRTAVRDLQRAFVDDPPAIFLAWSERARAISRRFAVTPPEQDQDVISTIGLWTPRNDEGFASRN
jgi:peptide/nickel transport system substrate-binding protein